MLCPIDSELESSVKPHFLCFNEQTSSLSANAPVPSKSNGCWPLIGSLGVPGGAQSVHSRGTANEPLSAWRRLNVATPETFLIFSTTN
jgi:hypothetical protein